MANISYLWQLISSMQDAESKLARAVKSGKKTDVTKIKALLFELQQRVEEEVKKNGK
jgi:hypothetical protein